ncbi:TIGR00730 family Rossman fold protein [Marinobacter halodurans]|uniref:Cytokinin riboside 5'-monophosphate phosphoribohydrolase n=1 Tax=Marinobacter halodurans TaxID=2528979 RepID=A0ABY1ZMM5_9GAMM|nr:TIGR00730 family Rossman fold protein [Marinobacter halodurans]TBW54376.1 TIGR00730 family Rossman fold protein [Marinobacter halodurans]
MRVAVFCGSSHGNDPVYGRSARAMGRALAEGGHTLVYGGGKVGLMGVVADTVLEHGGEVIGVIPRMLKEREIAHEGVTELFVVDDMHERKGRMNSLAQAFIAMPGGPGTLEEIFEAWTWAQLGYHEKPCAFYNVAGYYDPLLAFMDTMRDREFLKPHYRDMLIVSDEPSEILSRFETYSSPQAKWR